MNWLAVGGVMRISFVFECLVGRCMSLSGVLRIEFSEVEWPEPDGFKFTILTGKSSEFSGTKDDKDSGDPESGSEGLG